MRRCGGIFVFDLLRVELRRIRAIGFYSLKVWELLDSDWPWLLVHDIVSSRGHQPSRRVAFGARFRSRRWQCFVFGSWQET